MITHDHKKGIGHGISTDIKTQDEPIGFWIFVKNILTRLLDDRIEFIELLSITSPLRHNKKSTFLMLVLVMDRKS